VSAQDVIDAAWAWAESTRVYPPDGDADAENHLLECAQSLYNADTSGPPDEIAKLRAALLESCDIGDALAGQADAPEHSHDEGWQSNLHAALARLSALRAVAGGK
jgi:hypothetical protein